jgi:hypothetical protein
MTAMAGDPGSLTGIAKVSAIKQVCSRLVDPELFATVFSPEAPVATGVATKNDD